MGIVNARNRLKHILETTGLQLPVGKMDTTSISKDLCGGLPTGEVLHLLCFNGERDTDFDITVNLAMAMYVITRK